MLFILGSVGLILGGFFVLQLSRNVMFGWVCLLLSNLYMFTFGLTQSNVGPVNVDLIDLVSSALFLAGLIRFARQWREGSTSQTVTALYACLFLFSLLRGIVEYGFKPAGNEARGLIASMVGMMYFFSVPREEAIIKQFLTYYLYYAGALFFVGALAYAGLPVGGTAFSNVDASLLDDRLLPSPAAAAIAASFVIIICWKANQNVSGFLGKWMSLAAPLLLAMAVLLRTRTVWLMLIAVGLTVPLIDRKALKKFVPYAVLGVMSTLVLGAVFYADTGGMSQQLESSSNESGTWQWRVEGWRELILDNDQTAFTMLVGKPIGGGYWRFAPQTGNYINLPPHSEYVSQYLCSGIIGLVAVLVLLFRPIVILARLHSGRDDPFFPSASTWSLVCIGAVMYGVTYSISPDIWAFIGLANGLLLDRHEPVKRMALPSLDLKST